MSETNPRDQYVAGIEWWGNAAPTLPNLVGPFKTREEADEWCRLNVPNGTWTVGPLAWPYMDRTP